MSEPALPAEMVHLPFDAGAYRMAMDLTSVPESDWFEFDRLYKAEMAEKRRLLASRHAEVFATLPVAGAAGREALSLIAAALTGHHPDWFSRDGAELRNHLTGETWVIGGATVEPGGGGASIDPLECAERLVQEDLCLIQEIGGAPVFTAAALCFPSRWRLTDKIGKPLSEVHAPVPLYQQRLARPVDRFMRHVKPGHIACRLNWSLLDDPALFQPEGKWRSEGASGITPENAGQRVFLRVERQTLRRLPVSAAVLFGIRVHVYPLRLVIDSPRRAARLEQAIRALPPEVQHYKSLLPFRDALLAWLRR